MIKYLVLLTQQSIADKFCKKCTILDSGAWRFAKEGGGGPVEK